MFWEIVLLSRVSLPSEGKQLGHLLLGIIQKEGNKNKDKFGCIGKHCMIMFVSSLRWAKGPDSEKATHKSTKTAYICAGFFNLQNQL